MKTLQYQNVVKKHQCAGCEMRIPTTWYCLDCGWQIAEEAIPGTHAQFGSDRSEHISRMADAADHESVTFDTLRSSHDAYERPLGEYLRADEQPELVLPLKKVKITDAHDNSWSVSAGLRTRGHCIVTRNRVVGLLPKSSQPQVVPANFSALDDASAATGRISTAVVLDGEYEYKYTVDASGADVERTVELIDYFRQYEAETDEEAMEFLVEANQRVEASDDAETALRSLADLFAERDGPVQFDQVVADASTVDDLIAAVTVQQPVTPGAILSDIEGGTTGDVAPLHQRAAATVKNADPKAVGAYSLGALIYAGTAPISAPISTAVAFGGVLTTGTALGLYADANPDSYVGSVDPIKLSIASRMRGRRFAASAGAGGMKTGMLLEAAKHVGEANKDRAGAQWLTEIDIDSVMKGQKLAVEYEEAFNSPREASLFGGAVGLMYGYADADDDLDELVDDDILEEVTGDTELPGG